MCNELGLYHHLLLLSKSSSPQSILLYFCEAATAILATAFICNLLSLFRCVHFSVTVWSVSKQELIFLYVCLNYDFRKIFLILQFCINCRFCSFGPFTPFVIFSENDITQIILLLNVEDSRSFLQVFAIFGNREEKGRTRNKFKRIPFSLK